MGALIYWAPRADEDAGGDVAQQLAVSGGWLDRFIGDFRQAPATDLTVASSLISVPNLAPEVEDVPRVASCEFRSNAGDPLPLVAQGAIATFATSPASGLVVAGPGAINNFTNTTQQAPHVHTTWGELLGEDPRAGAEYAFLIHWTAQDLNTTQQAFGPGIYEPNDGSPPPNLEGNPSPDDEKCWRGWMEVVTISASPVLGPTIREESTTFRQINGARLPNIAPPAAADAIDSVGYLFRGSSIAQGMCGVAVDGVPPRPNDCTPIVGDFLGGSQTIGTHAYMDPLERVAIAFQTISSNDYTATVQSVRVMSRFG